MPVRARDRGLRDTALGRVRDPRDRVAAQDRVPLGAAVDMAVDMAAVMAVAAVTVVGMADRAEATGVGTAVAVPRAVAPAVRVARAVRDAEFSGHCTHFGKNA